MIMDGFCIEGRGTVKCVKKIKGKKGGPDRYELIVTLDLVSNAHINIPFRELDQVLKVLRKKYRWSS